MLKIIIRPYSFLRKMAHSFEFLGIISKRRTFFLVALGILVLSTEALGFISIMPIIELIQNEQNIDKFIQKADYAEKLIRFFNFFSLPFNLLVLSLLFLFIFFIRLIFNYFLQVEFEKEKFKVARVLSVKLFQNIMLSKSEYIKSLKNGGFTEICGNESEKVGNLYKLIIGLFNSLFQTLVFISIMFYVNFLLSALALLIVSSIGLMLSVILKKTYYLGADAVKMRTAFFGYISEAFGLWRITKFSDVLNNETKRVDNIIEKYATYSVSTTKVKSLTVILFGMTAFSVCILILNLSVSLYSLNLSQIGLFSLILVRLIPLGQKMITLFGGILSTVASLDLAVKILSNSRLNRENIEGGMPFKKIEKYIEFKNIDFKFQENNPYILKNLNLRIPANKITAILGKSGAGKSTLIDLIPRILIPSKGKIFIDELDSDRINLLSLRNKISFVPQEVQLFEGSLKENISYFNIGASVEEIYRVIELAGLLDYVNSLENGIHTIIRERGVSISGGQKQRIAIARAFLSKAPILILDEPTSSLDIENENKINLSIRSLQKNSNKTVIIITHRFNAVKNYDFVAYLEKGRIKSFGKPKVFLKKYFKNNSLN